MIRVKFGTILFNSRPSALVGPPNEKRFRKAPWWTELLTFKVETWIGTHKMRWKTSTPNSCLYNFCSVLDAVWSFFCVEDLRVKDLLGMCLLVKKWLKWFFEVLWWLPLFITCSLQSSNHSNWCRVLYTNDTTTSMVKICLTWTNPVTTRKSRDINTKYMYDDSNTSLSVSPRWNVSRLYSLWAVGSCHKDFKTTTHKGPSELNPTLDSVYDEHGKVVSYTGHLCWASFHRHGDNEIFIFCHSTFTPNHLKNAGSASITSLLREQGNIKFPFWNRLLPRSNCYPHEATMTWRPPRGSGRERSAFLWSWNLNDETFHSQQAAILWIVMQRLLIFTSVGPDPKGAWGLGKNRLQMMSLGPQI